MADSNVRRLKKKYAANIEAEIFTINTEINEIIPKIQDLDIKTIRHLDLENIKRLRNSIQDLKRMVNALNTHYRRILEDNSNPNPYKAMIESEDKEHLLIVDPHRLHLAQICDDEEVVNANIVTDIFPVIKQ